MATIDIGKIKMVWKGAWNSGTAYTKDDAVSHSGSSYICIQAGTNQNPATATAYWELMAQAGTNGTNGTDGTDVGTTITTQGDILYRDGSGLQRLAAGTSGQLLQTGGSGANPSWTTFSSDCVKLAAGTVGNVASVSVDGYFTSDYDFYKLIIMNLRNDNANRQFRFRVNQGGSEMSSASYRFGTDGMYTHTNGSTDYNKVGSWGAQHFYNGWDLSTGSDRGSQFELDIYDPLSTTNEKFVGYRHLMDVTDASYFSYMEGGVYFNDGGGTALSGITFFPQADNFNTGGKWKLYGFKA